MSQVQLLQLLAHQGGWDEILMVVAPLGIVGSLLWLANKRISSQLEDAETSDTSTLQTLETDDTAIS